MDQILTTPMSGWRKSLGLTQKKAGEAMGLGRRVIQYYESGEHEIPVHVRLAMAYLAEHPEAIDGWRQFSSQSR